MVWVDSDPERGVREVASWAWGLEAGAGVSGAQMVEGQETENPVESLVEQARPAAAVAAAVAQEVAAARAQAALVMEVVAAKETGIREALTERWPRDAVALATRVLEAVAEGGAEAPVEMAAVTAWVEGPPDLVGRSVAATLLE